MHICITVNCSFNHCNSSPPSDMCVIWQAQQLETYLKCPLLKIDFWKWEKKVNNSYGALFVEHRFLFHFLTVS